ncbi:MAG: DEAD/DEAH box helicase [Pseudomonadota bacterium]
MNDFDTLGLAPALTAALSHAGFSRPTPIQAQAIPLAMAGRDILGLAQTGTGKTLAFGLPIVDHLLEERGKPAPRSADTLILAPTRELVGQIAESLRMLTKGTRLRVATVVGGQSINRQINTLKPGTDILVATPGRLIDLTDRGAVDLSWVGRLVLDEADQMLDLGFIHALRRIAPLLGTPRQTMLFSATMSKPMEELSRAYLTDPCRVQVAPPGKAADKVEQSVHFLQKPGKPAMLREILSRDLDALTLVFARTKHGAEKLMKGLVADGHNAASIHGNKTQGQRDRAIKAFRDGKITTLVATDIAARGIDIPGVAYVVNYDLPDVPDNYVHRIGRTARAGREGQAIALCAPEEVELLHQIERFMKVEIPVASGIRPSREERAPQRRGPKPAASNRGEKPGAPKRRRSRRRRAA